MIRKLNSKLKSRQGESLGEVLVAILIVALGSLLFASMVTASIRIVNKGKAAYSKNMNLKNQIESFVTNEGGSDSSTESEVKQGTGKIKIDGTVKGSDDTDLNIILHEDNINVNTVKYGSEIYRYTYKK
jgi:competence protein ComGC